MSIFTNRNKINTSFSNRNRVSTSFSDRSKPLGIYLFWYSCFFTWGETDYTWGYEGTLNSFVNRKIPKT